MATETSEIKIPTKVSIYTKYLGDNSTWGFGDIIINITINKLGHMIYLEEYFTVDSNQNPKYAMTNKYYDNNITNNTTSFQILRPFGRAGRLYSLIRGVVLLDNRRVYEKWINTINGTHLTYSDLDTATEIRENIDKYEVEDNVLIENSSVTYKFIAPELAIYEVDVISTGNENYVPLRIESLKGIPIRAQRFPGVVYKYLNVLLDTYKVKKIYLRYKVENSWINSHDVSGENVKLFTWNDTDNKWYGLKTKIINKDNNYTYYESEAVYVSRFAIAGLRDIVTTANQTTTNQTTNTLAPIQSSTKELERNRESESTNKESEPTKNGITIAELIKNIKSYIFKISP